MQKVVIGLSGGIDSTMAAFLLKQQGYEVVGVHFSFVNEKHSEQLEWVKQELDIEVINIDISDDFNIVKQYFANEYLRGRTPSPCTFCNRVIKWKKLIDFADKNNCQFISSGHYIQTIEKDGFKYLKKGIDEVKDQSYFMWELTSDIINRMLTPLGVYTKPEIRQMAIENGFTQLASKKESMGVCFLENTDYRDFLRNYIPEKLKQITQGDVIDEDEQIIGTHQGFIHYTIGQKRGLDINQQRAAYVTHIDSENNQLQVGTKEALNHYHILVSNISLINPQDISLGDKVMINIRGLGLNPDEPALVTQMSSDFIELQLQKPAWAVAPGQPVVFYDEEIVLGGGIAEKGW